MSSVPAVLAALAALGSATLSADVQVVNGSVGSVTFTKEQYFLIGDDEIPVEREFDSMSTVTTSEVYVVPLTCGADLQATDQALADAAADTIYEAMLTAILGHPAGPTLGLGDGISVLPIG